MCFRLFISLLCTSWCEQQKQFESSSSLSLWHFSSRFAPSECHADLGTVKKIKCVLLLLKTVPAVFIALFFTHRPSGYFSVHIAPTVFVCSLFCSGIIVLCPQHICPASSNKQTCQPIASLLNVHALSGSELAMPSSSINVRVPSSPPTPQNYTHKINNNTNKTIIHLRLSVNKIPLLHFDSVQLSPSPTTKCAFKAPPENKWVRVRKFEINGCSSCLYIYILYIYKI